MQDIEGVDPSYFKTLSWMLENDITDILDMNFTEEVDYFGRMEIKDLKPGGKDIKVTEGNKREYINLKAQHYMTTAIKAQLQAFLQGFWDLIPQVQTSHTKNTSSIGLKQGAAPGFMPKASLKTWLPPQFLPPSHALL